MNCAHDDLTLNGYGWRCVACGELFGLGGPGDSPAEVKIQRANEAVDCDIMAGISGTTPEHIFALGPGDPGKLSTTSKTEENKS